LKKKERIRTRDGKIKKKLKVLEEEFKETKKQEEIHRKITDEMFVEANNRLKLSVKKRDMHGIKITQSLLETAKHLKKKEKQKIKIKKFL